MRAPASFPYPASSPPRTVCLVLLAPLLWGLFSVLPTIEFQSGWLGLLVAGLLGTIGHYSLTKAFSVADISATQSLRFLDLVWASLLGWLVFGDFPSQWTWLGAAVILVSTVWIARREGRRKEEPPPLNAPDT